MINTATPTNYEPSVPPEAQIKSYQGLAKKIAASYTPEDAVIHIVFGFIWLAGAILYAFNAIVLHFTIPPIPLIVWLGFPGTLVLLWVVNYAHKLQWSHVGLFTGTFITTAMTVFSSLAILPAILATPFNIIDLHLVQWDLWLGFDVTKLMAWVQQYPFFVQILRICYFSWSVQILVTPVLLALFKRSKEIKQFFIAMGISFLCSVSIYYFFPTIAPAGVMSSPHFTLDQYDLIKRFYEVHSFLPISTFRGGMISFPSDHVLFSILVLVAFRNVKILFYPLLVVNSLLIFATMALGYHYLVDVIASFVIAGGALLCAKYVKNMSKNLPG